MLGEISDERLGEAPLPVRLWGAVLSLADLLGEGCELALPALGGVHPENAARISTAITIGIFDGDLGLADSAHTGEPHDAGGPVLRVSLSQESIQLLEGLDAPDEAPILEEWDDKARLGPRRDHRLRGRRLDVLEAEQHRRRAPQIKDRGEAFGALDEQRAPRGG